MKKLFLSLTLISILAVLVLPMVVNGQVDPAKLSECCKLRKGVSVLRYDGTTEETTVTKNLVGPENVKYCKHSTNPSDPLATTDADKWIFSPDWGGYCLVNTIEQVTNWVFFIFIALTVIFVIIGGITFMTAAGDPEKTTKGRKFIVYALVGVVIGVLAKAIPAIIRAVIGL